MWDNSPSCKTSRSPQLILSWFCHLPPTPPPLPTHLYNENRISRSSHNSYKLLPISSLFLFIIPFSWDSTLCIEKMKLFRLNSFFFLLSFFLTIEYFRSSSFFPSCSRVYGVLLPVLRFTEFSFLFLGLWSFPFCSQVYRVFLPVLRFTEFSFSFSGLRSFLSRSQVYGVFLLVLRFTEFSFSFSGLCSFPSRSQVYGVFLLVLRFM